MALPVNRRSACALLALVVSFTLYQAATADSQDLTTSPTSFSVDAGSSGLEVTVSYDTTPTGLQTTGAGISVFYDSAYLTFVSFAVTYDEDLTQATRTPDSVVADSANLDENSATDKRAIIAYTSFTGAWPDEDDSDRPLELFKVTFDAAKASWAGETPINLVITSGAGGYTASNPTVTVEFISETADTDGDGTANNADTDDDGESATEALSDGLLVLRYLFGFGGDSLIVGAVTANATRTTATEIESYIESRITTDG